MTYQGRGKPSPYPIRLSVLLRIGYGLGLPLPWASSKRIWYTHSQSSYMPCTWGITLYMPRILGITGNIACGKTAVGQMLLDMGAERYIDADAVVHRLYLSGQPIAVQVAAAFGLGCLHRMEMLIAARSAQLSFMIPRRCASWSRLCIPQ